MHDDKAAGTRPPTRRQIVWSGATAPLWLSSWLRSATADQPAPDVPTASKQDRIVLTIVYDNYPGTRDLATEWGFSCLVQGPAKTILFDTGGKGDLLLDNMRRLELDPGQIDAVVLSHIHWDHVGGLPSILHDRTGLPVYVPTGFPASFLAGTRSLGAEVVEADSPVEVCPQVRTTGTMGKGRIDEQGLCVNTGAGWLLVTGCAHPGIHKMTGKAAELLGQAPHLVVGGDHLLERSEQGLGPIVDRFKELGVQKAAPTHCSGDLTRNVFKQRLGDRCELVGAGHVFEFPAPAPTA